MFVNDSGTYVIESSPWWTTPYTSTSIGNNGEVHLFDATSTFEVLQTLGPITPSTRHSTTVRSSSSTLSKTTSTTTTVDTALLGTPSTFSTSTISFSGGTGNSGITSSLPQQTPSAKQDHSLSESHRLAVELAVPLAILSLLAALCIGLALRRDRARRRALPLRRMTSAYNARPFGMREEPKTWSQTSFTTPALTPSHTGDTRAREHAPQLPDISIALSELSRHGRAVHDDGSKRCPDESCRSAMQRTKGSNCVTCPKCRCGYCWQCLAPQAEVSGMDSCAHKPWCKLGVYSPHRESPAQHQPLLSSPTAKASPPPLQESSLTIRAVHELSDRDVDAAPHAESPAQHQPLLSPPTAKTSPLSLQDSPLTIRAVHELPDPDVDEALEAVAQNPAPEAKSSITLPERPPSSASGSPGEAFQRRQALRKLANEAAQRRLGRSGGSGNMD